MKSLFSFLLILLCGMGQLPCTAQQYFNKRYTLHSGASIISGALEHNGRFYSTAISLDSSNYDIVSGGFFNRWGVRFTSYAANGDIIKDTIYQRKDRKFIDTWSNNLSVLSDGTFVLAANAADTTVMFGQYITYSCLLQFDSAGNMLQYKEFARPYCLSSDPNYYIVWDFKSDAYGNWLMLSSMLCNGNNLVFNLRKLDSGFNEVWVKNFTTSSYHNMPKHLLIEEDGYLMTGGINNGNTKLHPDYYTSVLIKCDTAGNKLWDWQNAFDTTKLQYTINDIIRTKDDGYVYCGTGEGRPTYYAWGEWADIKVYGFVEKLDASRNSVWKRKIGFLFAGVNQNAQSILKELPNGDMMVAGTIAKYYDIIKERGNTKASLTKLSGIDGSIIWQRLYDYSPDTLSGFIYDMRQTADGGYILAGECKDDAVFPFVGPVQRGWLVKVDSNGCEWAGSPCNPTKLPELTETAISFSIYPNPSDGTMTITSLRGGGTTTKQSAKVYDMLGRVLQQQNLSFNNKEANLNLNLPSATYILELKDETGNMQRERIVIQ